jgi:hypothetical protein
MISVDDVDLRGSDERLHWDEYLARPISSEPAYDNMGWCVEQPWFASAFFKDIGDYADIKEALPTNCCSANSLPSQCCFAQVEDRRNRGCLSDKQILALAHGSFKRCLDTCSGTSICVWPHPAQPITRLAYLAPGDETAQMIVFTGNKHSLAAQIVGGVLASSRGWVPSAHHFEAFLQ